jgi:hypothetical protein
MSEIDIRWGKRSEDGSCNFCSAPASIHLTASGRVLVIKSPGGLVVRICRGCLRRVNAAAGGRQC